MVKNYTVNEKGLSRIAMIINNRCKSMLTEFQKDCIIEHARRQVEISLNKDGGATFELRSIDTISRVVETFELNRTEYTEYCVARIRPNIYEEHGHADRDAYLEHLAETHDVDIEIVKALADVSGESEDFDGLVVAVQDAVESEGW